MAVGDGRTIAAANGVAIDENYRAVTPPLYLTSTFAFTGYEQTTGYDYSRTANPTRDLLADTLAKLEGGAGAVITCSGMAAIDLILSRLASNALVVAPHDCYAGTRRLLKARSEKGEFDVVFVDQGDGAALDRVLHRIPALVFIETPSNPLMRVVDIRSIAERAKAVGALVAVDNTFLSPALQQPISLGADFVIHSTTKYLNGHSDVVGGAVVAASHAEAAALSDWANVTGVIGAPFDSYMTLRGIRTLFVRVAQQEANAMAIANFLRVQPQVAAVHYPGLADHPGHAIAAAQQSGFGAMLSFELRGGTPAVKRFVEAVRVFTLAESLGGVESLVAHPATMTHASMNAETRRDAGIGDGLLRLSVGLEDESDLIAGLAAGLAASGR
ncbi:MULTISPECIES: cystathionine gamma-synthase [unclassified Sinorhizobium]|uniref:cystathionine gamma-synthase n=1 Tax=unclassified Sinorhizobium TaxID=2613772 RepID=UPI0035250F70